MLIRKKATLQKVWFQISPETPEEHSLCDCLCLALQSRNCREWLAVVAAMAEPADYFNIMVQAQDGGRLVSFSHRTFLADRSLRRSIWE